MNHKLESKELYEIIRHFDDFIEVPHSIAHGDFSKFLTSFNAIISIIKKHNDSANDPKERLRHLITLSTHLLRLVDEMLEDQTKIKYKHGLVIKQKNYVIDGLKKYIASKEDLDAEIPSDDDDKEPTSATNGLSDKEKKILGIK